MVVFGSGRLAQSDLPHRVEIDALLHSLKVLRIMIPKVPPGSDQMFCAPQLTYGTMQYAACLIDLFLQTRQSYPNQTEPQNPPVGTR